MHAIVSYLCIQKYALKVVYIYYNKKMELTEQKIKITCLHFLNRLLAERILQVIEVVVDTTTIAVVISLLLLPLAVHTEISQC